MAAVAAATVPPPPPLATDASQCSCLLPIFTYGSLPCLLREDIGNVKLLDFPTAKIGLVAACLKSGDLLRQQKKRPASYYKPSLTHLFPRAPFSRKKEKQ